MYNNKNKYRTLKGQDGMFIVECKLLSHLRKEYIFSCQRTKDKIDSFQRLLNVFSMLDLEVIRLLQENR